MSYGTLSPLKKQPYLLRIHILDIHLILNRQTPKK